MPTRSPRSARTNSSYSHSNGRVDDKASLLAGATNANYKWTSLEYKDPTIRVVGPAAIVRFNFVGEQEFHRRQEDAAEPPHPDELAEAGQRLEAAVAGGDEALIAVGRQTPRPAPCEIALPKRCLSRGQVAFARRRAARSASRALRNNWPSSRLNLWEAAKKR